MTDTLSDITAEMEAEDNDPVPDAYAKGYADGYKAKALAAGKAQPSEISVHPALATAAEILANFKTEGNKLEEWQACYAKLFTQMNEICNQKRESKKRKSIFIGSKVEWVSENFNGSYEMFIDPDAIYDALNKIEGGKS